MADKTHYTAVLKINRTTSVAQVVDRYGNTTTPASRETLDLVEVTFREDTLDALADKLVTVVNLVAPPPEPAKIDLIPVKTPGWGGAADS
jgi:hypothetical protein